VFERFLEVYGPTQEVRPEAMWAEPALMAMRGYAKLMPRLAGLGLGGGLLRFVSAADGPLAQKYVREAFPDAAERAVPFARDWLGRHFSLDRARKVGPMPQLLLLEPGSGEALEIDEGFEDFLNVDLVEDPVTYLESGLFDLWRASGQNPGTF
jgi:hypothetical protein